MKKITTLLSGLALVAALTVACTDDDSSATTPEENICLPEELQNGLIALFPLNNGYYNDVITDMGMSFGETTTTAPDRAGNPKCAVAFDGTDQSYLNQSTTDMPLDGLTEMSISLWYQPQPKEDQSTSFETLISRGDGLRCPDTNGQWSIGLYDGRQAVFGHGNSLWEWDDTAMTSTSWKHIVATWNQDDNTMKIYINGVLAGSETGVADCGNGPVEVNDEGILYIGKGFTGNIDDIAIYNRELSAAEATQLFNLAACCE